MPALSDLPARLVAGCATWVGIATALELMSGVGFLVTFALVFCGGLTARQSLVAGLRALGASTILPGGSLFGPAVAARSMANRPVSLRGLAVRSIAFLLLTTVPGVAALALTGISLWLGWPPGPHGALLTLPAAAAALAMLAAMWLLGRPAAGTVDPCRFRPRSPWARWLSRAVASLRDGAADARRLLVAKRWTLVAAVAYYVFDNALLWAAFRAYGSEPPIGVLVMGYLVGSLGSAVPIPGGFGAVEGGLIGGLVLYGAPLGPAAAAVLLYRGISLGLAVALGVSGWTCRWPSSSVDTARRGRILRATSLHSMMSPRSRSSAPRRPSPAGSHSSE